MEEHEKKQRIINVSEIIGVVLIIGILTLLGNIIVSHVQENKISIEPTTQEESVAYLKKPQTIKNFLFEGSISSNGGKFLETEYSQDEDVDRADETVKVDEDEDEDTESTSIINADHYSCSLEDIYYVTPVRTYTEEEKELLAKMLYCEARGCSWDGQVATCSAIINHIEHYGGSFSVLDNVNKFEPAPYYRSKTPNQMQYDVVNYVLSGHLIADVKYFRMNRYHNFGTPMFAIDGEYFSK